MLLEQRILDLQKDKGALIDKVRELEKEKAYDFKKGAEFGYNKGNEQLTKAKEIIKDYMIIAKGAHITVCGVPEENRTIYILKLNEKAEEFLNSEVVKK